MPAIACRMMRSERARSVALEPFPEEGIGEAVFALERVDVGPKAFSLDVGRGALI